MIKPVPQHGEATTLRLADINIRAQIRTRNGFDAESLGELAASIKEHGLLQPVVVTPAAGGGYDLLAGERRVLAASMAGLDEVPAMVRSGTVGELAAAQAVENLQRQDLHPADIAEGLNALAMVLPTWRDVARAVGKSPAWVSKHRALLRLRPITRALMAEGHTSDLELLLSLNQIEKQFPEEAAHLAENVAQGVETRETIRGKLAALNARRAKVAGKVAALMDDGDGEAADEGDKPEPRPDTTKAAPVPSLRLTAGQLRALHEHLEATVPHAYAAGQRALAEAADKVKAAWSELLNV